MTFSALLYNLQGNNTEVDQKALKKSGIRRHYLASKFAKAALISACIGRNCSCLPLDGYSSQLFASQRSSGWYVQ